MEKSVCVHPQLPLDKVCVVDCINISRQNNHIGCRVVSCSGLPPCYLLGCTRACLFAYSLGCLCIVVIVVVCACMRSPRVAVRIWFLLIKSLWQNRPNVCGGNKKKGVTDERVWWQPIKGWRDVRWKTSRTERNQFKGMERGKRETGGGGLRTEWSSDGEVRLKGEGS